MAQDNKKPLHTLYESLVADNYDVPDTYESFERTLTASGKEGTDNRIALYKTLKADNYDVPDTYESFANTLFVPVERPKAEPTAVSPSPSPTPPQEPWRPTEHEKIAMSRQLGKMQVQTSKALADSQERVKKVAETSRALTAAADMSVNAQIRRAYAQRDEMMKKADNRRQEIDKLNSDMSERPFLASIMAGGDATTNSALGSSYQNDLLSDATYRQYRAAIEECNQRIKTLENERYKQNGGDVGFWRGFGQTITDPETWLGGTTGLLDANAKLAANVAPNAESAQSLMQATAENDATQSVYGDFGFWNRAGVMTAEMLPFMLDFAITGGGFDAVNLGGRLAAKGTTKLIGKEALKEMTELGVKAYTRKYGVRGFGRMAENWTIKALGTTADDLLIRAPLLTNTAQIGETAADIVDRKLGDVVVDEDGNYDFSNDKTWGSAVWQGEANAIIENYSEMFGAHLDGVVPALAKTFGGKRISGMLARANASSYGQILNTTREHFQRLGVSDYFGEVSEEYYGQLWRTMLNLDDAYQQNPDGTKTNLLFTGQFHGDIWGGMALSMGLIGAGKYSISGIAYGSMKHQVNKADKKASEIFTPERWEPIRELIDSTTNEDMGTLAENMANDQNLSDNERSAVMEYMERSLNLRGLNLGSMAQSRGTQSEEQSVDGELSQSYLDGYEAQSQQEMTDAQNMYEYQRQRAEGVFEPSTLDWLDGNPVNALMEMSQNGLYTQEEIDAALDYINAKTVRDGIFQRVNDDIDEQIAQSDAMISGRINQATGMIQPALMGLDDRQVYVVGGSLAVNPDGTVDRDASDESIVVRDAQTGALEFTDPKSISSVMDEIDPELEKANAIDAIRQQAAQAAADAMNGTLAFNSGDTVQINSEGGFVNATIVGPAIDEESGMPIDGQIVVQFPDGQPAIFTKEQLQAFADSANLERLNGFEQERAAARAQRQATEAEAKRPQFRLNDKFTILDKEGKRIYGVITLQPDDSNGNTMWVDYYDNPNYDGQPFRNDALEPEKLLSQIETYTPAATTEAVPENADSVPSSAENTENAIEIGENPTESVPNGAETATEPQQSALSRIPVDEQGQPKYDEADPDTAWDAIVEQAEGDEAIAAEVVADIVADREEDYNAAEKALAKTKEGKPEKRKKDEPAPTMAERIAAKNAAKAALSEAQAIRDKAKIVLDHWKKIAGTKQRREADSQAAEEAEARRVAQEAAEQEARLKSEREEAERKEREALNGVPDWNVDTPADARARGFRRNGPQKVDRPEVIDNYAFGNAVEVKFADNVMPRGNVVVIEASQLQPSHREGQRNPAHFLDEAQPKERKDAASRHAAAKIAEGIRPEEITSSITAYTGAPSVNSRGEVIQGNNRSEALRIMYERNAQSAERYKQYLIEHAAEFGLTPEAIAAFEQPVLVNMLDVPDEEAITLGQYVAQDTESGGIERIKPKNAVQKMGDKIRTFANLLLRSTDDEDTFAQLVDANGVEALKWMNQQGIITNTQYASAFDSKGNLSAEAANDLKGIMYQSIFTGGSTRLEEMFNNMPAKTQRAILATAFRDYDSPLAERMISEIQQSIIAFNALMAFEQFRDATNAATAQNAVEAWKKQYAFDDVSGESYLPSKTFSNFALALAAMYKCHTQKHIQSVFNMMYDIVQGTEQDNLFETADKTPKPLAEAIRRVLNLEYQPITKQDNGTNGSTILDVDSEDGQAGRSGSEGNADGAEQSQSEAAPSDSGTGTASDSGQGSGIEDNSLQTLVASAEAEVNTNPTEAQKKAGNYKMGHVKIDGLEITIENPKGSVRRGTDAEGKAWETKMNNTYGYIRGTTGVDGDKIDVFLSDNPAEGNVYVVDQYNEGADGAFDEHKVMYGFATADEAEAAYLSNYSADWTKNRKIVVTGVTREEFKKWLDASDRKTKPFAEYKSVKPLPEDETTEQVQNAEDGAQSKTNLDNDKKKSNFELTENDINSINDPNISEEVKDGARDWLAGERDSWSEMCFKTIEDYVRNSGTDSIANSDDANGTQLAGTPVEEDGGGLRDGTEQSGGADRQDGDKDVAGVGDGLKDGSRDSGSVSGEKSSGSVEGTKPDYGSKSGRAGKSGRGRRTGSNGGDVRKPGRQGGNKPNSKNDGGRASEGDSISKGEQTAQELIDDALNTFKDIFKNPGMTEPGRLNDVTTLLAGLGVNAVRFLGATAKLGCGLVLKGYYKYARWQVEMHKALDPVLHEYTDLTDEQIAEFLKSAWDMKMTYRGERKRVSEWAAELEVEELRKLAQMSIEDKRKAQKEAESTEVVNGDLDNIRQTLPFLLPAQHEDVEKAEKQFFSEGHNDREHGYGKGYLFTNGTGTGKTYTGLGIVKRFLKQGKGRVLIVTVNDTKISDWIKDAANLGIKAKQLADTKSKGEGVVVTQYANLRQNYALLEDEFDLIVYDESHKLMENQQGEVGSTATMHHLLANRDAESVITRELEISDLGKSRRAVKEEIVRLNELLRISETPDSLVSQQDREKLSGSGFKTVDAIEKAIKDAGRKEDEYDKEFEKRIEEALKNDETRKRAEGISRKSKVVFLSATPFNTPSSLDYAEGYIYSYPENKKGESHRDRRNKFLKEKFGKSYRPGAGGDMARMPEGQISDPEAVEDEEIEYSNYLQETLHTMSGRMLDSAYDYSRTFPKFEMPEAKLVNAAMSELNDSPLKEYFKRTLFDYNYSTAFWEIIKTGFAIPRIKEHIALGRKVVVFHRRKASNQDVRCPFATGLSEAMKSNNEAHKRLANEFALKYMNLLQWEASLDYTYPHERIIKEFVTEEETARYHEQLEEWEKKCEVAKKAGKKMPKQPKLRSSKVGVFNGDETASEKQAAVDNFNLSGSGQDVIVVQVQSGKEGISLHDTDGKHQRVMMSLALPQSPIEFIQAEGRIYRVGNKSDAIFEYPLLGIDRELFDFAMKINGRSQTSENLAMGSQSRGLRDSITRGALGSTPMPVTKEQGKGGKMLDSRAIQEATGFDQAMSNWKEWRDNEKGKEYAERSIPDPLGQKLMEWAGLDRGETVLVGFAGEGSAARYAPASAKLIAIESDGGKLARLAALLGGGGRKILGETFMRDEGDVYSTNNKADVVVLKTRTGSVKHGFTIQHRSIIDVQKAISHTEDSGRVIAIVPTTDLKGTNGLLKAAEDWARYNGVVVRTVVNLPKQVFSEQSSVVILDRNTEKSIATAQAAKGIQTIDIPEAENAEDALAGLRNLEVTKREIDRIAKAMKRCKRALTPFINSKLVSTTRFGRSEGRKDAYVNRNGVSVHFTKYLVPKNGNLRSLYNGITINFKEIAVPSGIEEVAKTWKGCRALADMDFEVFKDEYIYEFRNEAQLATAHDLMGHLCALIEAATGKTATQLENLAEGRVENSIKSDMTISEFKDVFKTLDSENEEIDELAERVFAVAAKAEGLKFRIGEAGVFSGHNVMAHYAPAKNAIELNRDSFNSIRFTDAQKAQCILHETIHAVTCWAVAKYKYATEKERKDMGVMGEACADILDVYKAINTDSFRALLQSGSKLKDNAMYGLTDEYEMLAEMSNPAFRAALKAKKLWRQLVNGIKKLFGIDVMDSGEGETTAYEVLDKAINTILDNFNPEDYKEYEAAPSKQEHKYEVDEDVVYRTSEEIDAEYPNWLEGTTTESGKHSTQVEGTRKTYGKVGDWIESNLGKDVEILDASSGMGYGTADLRERGFNIEDVEPYQSEQRKASNPATYDSYGKIGKMYDFIISNAVLNVIPDDWRRDVLFDMAARLKAGGTLFINTRKAGEEKNIKDKIELDSPREVLVKRNGKIASYQRFFTPKELKEWVESELSGDYTVEIANEKNSGTKGLAAVVVTKNENVNRLGDGYGAYSDAEVSYANDPISKVMGKNRFSKKRQAEFAARERQRMAESVNELVHKLHLDNVEILTDASQLEGKRAKAKGFYNKRTGKITIVIPNHVSMLDAEQTLLHEAVAHYGLRKLFGEQFNTFLDNVYESADEGIRRKIAEMAAKNGWDFRTATEEYLASLAEDTNFEEAMNYNGWWAKIKRLFIDMLEKIGFEGFRDKAGVVLTDNELRYILWRSYENLAEPGRYRSILGEAADVAKQSELKVGNYAEQGIGAEFAAETGDLYRPGDFSPRDKVIARREYERMVSSGSYQFKEAVQDSMLGLKKLYQAILGKDTRIEDVAGFENAYLFENRMSSMNAGEQHEYFQRYMQPLLKEIAKIAGANKRKRRELTDYLMAKHGLERNEYMRNEAAANGEDTDRDFAGLIGLTGEADWKSAEATAQQWVDDYEVMVDTTALWQAINNATKATIEKIYLSGIISKETYEKILGMYQYYIPLRGWNETTSEQVYGYLTSKDGPLGGSIMKKAEGRESMADDPIATIGMMADDAIRQGNRNLMKQRFLNFILNHPSDVVSVHDIWLEYDDVADEWRPVFADVEATDTADEVAQKVEAFEQRMEALRSSNPDKYKKGREAQHIPYKVVKGNLREHQILIKRNGRTFVATINGNPRAAQALNGLTNPDVDQNGVVGNMLKAGTWINRQLSAFYTTRNPDFVVGNFFRDALYSNCMTWVKESPRYALRFHKNFGRVNPVVMRRLLGKWENGKLDMSNHFEAMFYQFMKNGGETGYTNVRDIEGHKRAVAAELEKQGSAGRRAWTALGMQLDLLNRSAENCARFAAFLTSRDFGRSIDRAIYDAKEVSVNFNKKGSGGKMVNANGQTALGKTGAYLGGGGRLLYVFWNAGVQGMTNFARQAKLHPAKFTTGAAALFTLGYVIPILAQMLGGGDGDDDDKNAYYNLPEYVRRSNICFRAGEQWITIPLPIEYRAMYGMGELAHGVISGNERYSDSELAYQMSAQISQIMPLDMLEGGGGVSPFIPSAAKPFTEAYIMNKGWTGLPVYKDTPFNKNEPEWSKAYASADKHLVAFTKWLNETSGGDDFKKGSIDINPAKIEYLLNGTFGGMFTFPNKINKSIETAAGSRDFEWRNMPIANRLIKSGDERTANRKLQNEYFKYKKEYEETARLMRKYEKSDENGILGYAEKINFLENSPEYLRYEIFDEYKAGIDAYREDIAAETDKEEKVKLEAEMYGIMRELVNVLHESDKQE